MVVLGTLMILAGWWLLAAAMPPCQVSRARRLRVTGALALALSLGCYLHAIGFEQGPVFWAAALMLGALAVALLRAATGPGGGRPRRREPR